MATQPRTLPTFGDENLKIAPLDRGATAMILYHRNRHYLFDSWLSESYQILSRAFYHGKRVEPVLKAPPPWSEISGIFLSSAHGDHTDIATLADAPKHIRVYAHKSVMKKVASLHFANTHVLSETKCTEISESLRVVSLKGFGQNFGCLFEDLPTKTRYVIAPHGVNLRRIRKLETAIKSQFNACTLHTAFIAIGCKTTQLSLKGLPSLIFPDNGINIPFPSGTIETINYFRPHAVLAIHETHENASGWAARNLVHFPIENPTTDVVKSKALQIWPTIRFTTAKGLTDVDGKT